MVVGNGLIAKAFQEQFGDRHEVLIFASGVSQSKVSGAGSFEREKELVAETIANYPDKMFVYFGTCSVYDPGENSSPYVIHKLRIESIIRERCARFLIFRLSNVVGRTNNNTTIFNFLAGRIQSGLPFILWKNAFRNIIDIDDVAKAVSQGIGRGFTNQIINIANPTSYPVRDLVDCMERHFKKKGQYSTIEAGSYFEIDTTIMSDLCTTIGVAFPPDYVDSLLRKYFGLNKQNG